MIKIPHNLKIKFPGNIAYIPLSPVTSGNGVSQNVKLTSKYIEILCAPEGLKPTIFLYCYIPKLII